MRQTLRLLRQSPGFTFAAVACIALGVGVTTTMLSAVNGIAAVDPRPRSSPAINVIAFFVISVPSNW